MEQEEERSSAVIFIDCSGSCSGFRRQTKAVALKICEIFDCELVLHANHDFLYGDWAKKSDTIEVLDCLIESGKKPVFAMFFGDSDGSEKQKKIVQKLSGNAILLDSFGCNGAKTARPMSDNFANAKYGRWSGVASADATASALRQSIHFKKGGKM